MRGRINWKFAIGLALANLANNVIYSLSILVVFILALATHLVSALPRGVHHYPSGSTDADIAACLLGLSQIVAASITGYGFRRLVGGEAIPAGLLSCIALSSRLVHAQLVTGKLAAGETTALVIVSFSLLALVAGALGAVFRDRQDSASAPA